MIITNIELYKILRPLNPSRIAFDEAQMKELMESITNLGLINPITVEKEGAGYRVIAGDRRLEAHRRLALHTIQCIVRDPGGMTNGESLKLAENLERSDLTPWEEAREISRLHNDHHLTLDQLSSIAHRSEDWIKKRLLLAQLPEDLAPHVHERRLSIGCALALADVTEAPHRDYLTRYALDAGASIQCIREWVNSWKLARMNGATGTAPLPPPLDLTGPITVMIPCCLCGKPHDHTTMLILRACRQCAHEITTARTQDQTKDDIPDSATTPTER